MIAAFFGGVFLFFQCILFGQAMFPKRPFLIQFLYGLLLIFLSLTIIGSGIYLVWNLAAPAQSLVFLSIPVIGMLLLHHASAKQTQLQLEPQFLWNKQTLPTIALVFSYLVLAIASFSTLLSSRTTESITSPWDVLSGNFWLLYFLSTLIWVITLWRTKQKTLRLLLASIHLFLSYSIAVIIYQLGYGFDPFIHQQAQSLIAEQGIVLPKTPYYIGQYALVVSLHKLLGFSLLWIDKLLVPLLASITTPLFLSEWSYRKKTKEALTTNSLWLSIAFLFIPYSFFLSTTPQGLANTFFLLLVIGSFPLLTYKQDSAPLWLLWALGIASVVTHPLVGIPSILFLTLFTHEYFRTSIHHSKWVHRILTAIVFLIGSIAMPLTFFLNGLVSPQLRATIKSFSEIRWEDIYAWFPLRVFLQDNQFRSFFFEFGYFIQENIWWILSALIILMFYWLLSRAKYAYLRVYGLSAVIFLMNAIILSAFIDFPDLIQYENQAYSARLFQTAFWTISPLLLLALIWLYRRIANNRSYQLIMAFFLAWIVTGTLFASYPRNNRYELGRQYSVGAADIATVKKIGQNKSDFVVLANQSVSAAAIQEFGFRTYYITEDEQTVFYYPVPTSSPLYDHYLTMVYDQPSRANAQKAAELTAVPTVYFVLNEYWDNASQVAEQAKLQADEWVEIDGGKTIIFTYKF